eukprot:1185342-Amphidinium_carterae.1
MAALWGHTLHGKHVKDTAGHVPWTVCTDAKSLFDAIHQPNSNLEEKRLAIDIAEMQEALTSASSAFKT